MPAYQCLCQGGDDFYCSLVARQGNHKRWQLMTTSLDCKVSPSPSNQVMVIIKVNKLPKFK